MRLISVFLGAVIIVLGALTAIVYAETRANGIEAVERLQPAAEGSSRVIVGTSDMERGVSTYAQTGRAESLGSYAEGASVSRAGISDILTHIGNTNSELTKRTNQVRVARQVWITEVAQPMIEAVRDGDSARAQRIQVSVPAIARFEVLRALELALDAEIDSALTSEFDAMGVGAVQLAIVLIILFLLLIIITIGIHVDLRRSVLYPLGKLGDQLRTVARGQHKEVPIYPRGPKEIRQVSIDAEDMRRQLVHEIDEAREARYELKSEAEVVNAIREKLRAQQPSVEGVSVAGQQQTAEGLSGDWWEVVPLPDGCAAVIVTDISGHGWRAGDAGVDLKKVVVSKLRTGSTPDEALASGVTLFESSDSLFATIAIVVLDPAKSEVRWANGGHLAPMVIQSDYQTVRLDMTGPLLSTIGGVWSTQTMPLGPTDLVVMWTDGVTESRDIDGEELEDDGLEALVLRAIRHAGRDPAELVATVAAAARAQSVDWSRDDATLVIARLSE